MKKQFVTASFLCTSLFLAFPVYATPEAESCLNKLVQTEIPEMEGANAELLMSINHKGSQYHWLEMVKGRGAFGNVELIIKTGGQVGCGIALYSIPGPLPTAEDYDAVLGKEVSEKFGQAFKQEQQR